MKTLLWIDANKLNCHLVKSLAQKSDELNAYIYNDLSELSPFILNDLKPDVLVIDEAFVTEIHDKDLITFLNKSNLKVYMSASQDLDIKLPDFYTSKLEKPFSPHTFVQMILELSV